MIVGIEFDKDILTTIEALNIIKTFVASDSYHYSDTAELQMSGRRYEVSTSKSALVDQSYTIEEVK